MFNNLLILYLRIIKKIKNTPLSFIQGLLGMGACWPSPSDCWNLLIKPHHLVGCRFFLNPLQIIKNFCLIKQKGIYLTSSIYVGCTCSIWCLLFVTDNHGRKSSLHTYKKNPFNFIYSFVGCTCSIWCLLFVTDNHGSKSSLHTYKKNPLTSSIRLVSCCIAKRHSNHSILWFEDVIYFFWKFRLKDTDCIFTIANKNLELGWILVFLLQD